MLRIYNSGGLCALEYMLSMACVFYSPRSLPVGCIIQSAKSLLAKHLLIEWGSVVVVPVN